MRSTRTLLLTAVCAVPLAAAAPAHASFTGANGRIAFVDTFFGRAHVINPDGSDRRVIADRVGFSLAYSPNGRRITFGVPPIGGGGSQIYVMNADGSNQRQITQDLLNQNFDPSFSPDGRSLVFARLRNGDTFPDLWTIDLVTGRERQLTATPTAVETEPQWSPDGATITFDSDAGEPGNTDVYTIRANGHDLRRLTRAPGFDGQPDFSPDGRRIVFSSDRTGNPDVFVMRADGGHQTRLTRSLQADILPSYSPDGGLIAFSAGRDGNQIPDAPPGFTWLDIFRMRADGTRQTNLTATPDDCEVSPAWQPLP